MANNYTLNWSDASKGTITLAPAAVNTTSTSLTLFGRGAPNYGEGQQENFLKMLENFASATPPTNQTKGQLWYDTNSGLLMVNSDGLATGWTAIAGSTSGALTPVRAIATDAGNPVGLTGIVTVDGELLNAGDRVLVNDQAVPTLNGIYLVSPGNWSKVDSTNSELPAGEMIFVAKGVTYGGTLWYQAAENQATVGPIFQPVSTGGGGGGPTGTYTAGNGLLLVGNQFRVDPSVVATLNSVTPVSFTDLILSGDLDVNGGDIRSTAATFNLLNTGVSALNIGGAATSVTIGSTSGLVTIPSTAGGVDQTHGALVVGGTIAAAGGLNVGGVVKLFDTTPSANTSSGALVLTAGGLGVAGNGNFGGSLSSIGAFTTTSGLVNIVGTAPTLVFSESDQTLPAGRWAFIANGTMFTLRRNTDASNPFVSYQDIFTVDGTGNFSFGASVSPNWDSGIITTTAATGFIFNTNATTLNIGGAATQLNLGSSSPAAVVKVAGDLAVIGGDITTTSTTASLFNTNATTLNIGGSASTINVGSTTTQLKLTSTVDTSTGNGSIVTAGGVTIAKSVAIGANLTVAGTANTGALTAASANVTGALVAGGATVSGQTHITDTTVSNDVDTGALTVDGGVGINGKLNVGSNTVINGDLLVTGVATSEYIVKHLGHLNGAPTANGVLLSTGRVLIAGRNSKGELGNGTTAQNASFFDVQLPSGELGKIVDAGHYGQRTYVLLDNGNLYVSGDGTQGALGFTPTGDTSLFKLTTGNVVQVIPPRANNWQSGQEHIIIKKADNTWWSAGDGSTYIFGDNSTSDKTIWTQIAAPSGAGNITTFYNLGGQYGSFFMLTDTNRIFAAGHNSSGECGVGTNTIVKVWTEITVLAGKAIADIQGGRGYVTYALPAGWTNHIGSFTVFLLTNGEVWTCGDNTFGSLGKGSTGGADVLTATKVTLTKPVRKIVTNNSGRGTVYAIYTDNTFTRWGNNDVYQLANGTAADSGSPIDSAILVDDIYITSNASAYNYWCQVFLLKPDQTIWAAGKNAVGELGIGVETQPTAFTQIYLNVPSSKVLDIVALSSAPSANSSTGAVTDQACVAIIPKLSSTMFVSGYNDNGVFGIDSSMAPKTSVFRRISLG